MIRHSMPPWSRWALAAAIVFAALPPPGASAAEDLPRYRAPAQAADAGRVVGGQHRGTSDESLSIAVIAPDHTGLTTRAQPTLYWYASRPVAGRVEFTIQDEGAVRPLVEVPLRGVERGGVLPIRLSDFGVRLDPDREYRWSISVVTDDQARSRDVVTSGFIRRLPAGSEPAGGETAAQRVFRFADQGIWYDALEVLGQELERSPQDAQLRRQRAALLEQVGLREIAEQDRLPR